MRLRLLLAGLTILLTGTTLPAQIPGDVMGMHNLGPGSKSPITGARPDSCAYCHAPHSGLNIGPLEPEAHHANLYDLHQRHSKNNRGTQPMLGSDSNQCLSCHDGTVAVGSHRGLWPGHDARIDVHERRVRQQHAVVAPVQPGAAVEGQYRPGRLAGGERHIPATQPER